VTVPHNKDELLKAINTSFEKLFDDLKAIPAERTSEPSMEGHGKNTRMSVSNLLAYLVGWNELVLKWMDRDAAEQPIDYPDKGFKGNDLGKLAQRFYRDYEDVPYVELLDRLHVAKTRIVAFIESRDNADLYDRAWYDHWTMGRMIQLNTSSPYQNARGRLRKWMKGSGLSQVR